jgi:hypothetical protein
MRESITFNSCIVYALFIYENCSWRKRKRKNKIPLLTWVLTKEQTFFIEVLVYINFTSMQNARSVQVLIHRPQTRPFQFKKGLSNQLTLINISFAYWSFLPDRRIWAGIPSQALALHLHLAISIIHETFNQWQLHF